MTDFEKDEKEMRALIAKMYEACIGEKIGLAFFAALGVAKHIASKSPDMLRARFAQSFRDMADEIDIDGFDDETMRPAAVSRAADKIGKEAEEEK